jgi:predicted dithiol-disulfide oxidoreductase (DUF899 family)
VEASPKMRTACRCAGSPQATQYSHRSVDTFRCGHTIALTAREAAIGFSRRRCMPHKIVSEREWTAARLALLAREKELTRLRDQISRERRELPWVRLDKEYLFEGPSGTESLSDLFEGRSQLLVYHFMFDPGWSEGCKSCSFWADNYDAIVVHLAQRDVTMVTVSRAPLATIEPFKRRMGWRFKWVSSFGSDFNRDFHVSFTEGERKGDVYYNFARRRFGSAEAPGASVFYKDEGGSLYHTYSCYARGLDAMNGAYQWLDLTPKGRDEDSLSYSMAWVCHHDKYGA